MGQCKNNNGKPKVAHRTLESTFEHLAIQSKNDLHMMNSYRCSVCLFWHIGHIPASKDYKKSKKIDQAIEEKLVGQLISIIKKVINYQSTPGK